MKSYIQFILFLIVIISLGFLIRLINSEKKVPGEVVETKQSTMHLSFRDDELALQSVLILDQEKHFRNMRQLTFGGENAEAYFSADGSRLILQAHEGEGKCDQIYIMNIESGQVEMVSTGFGVTTCSFFQYPGDDAIIYSSTHMSDQKCPPKADPSLGYVWTLHPTFDILKADLDGSNVFQLTDTDGYDAEATYAFDGSAIVYTSLVSGDLDLWIMNSDGLDKRQLTHRLGYDGGAFFSHDGQKIVWRAYYPETDEENEFYMELLENNAIRPMALQIWMMNSDGSDQVQITDNDAANFAPFFFPDDNKIIFASNLGDPRGRNFDLYAINIDGSGWEQITFHEEFDGFPMFSPDGDKLVFASNRNSQRPGETNIFICEWIE